MPDITLSLTTTPSNADGSTASSRAQALGENILTTLKEYAGKYNIRLPADLAARATQLVPKKSGAEIVRVQLGWNDPEFPPHSGEKNIRFILGAVESLKEFKYKHGTLEENYPSAAA